MEYTVYCLKICSIYCMSYIVVYFLILISMLLFSLVYMNVKGIICSIHSIKVKKKLNILYRKYNRCDLYILQYEMYCCMIK